MRVRATVVSLLAVALLLVSCSGESPGEAASQHTGKATGATATDVKATDLLALNLGAAQTVEGLQARIASNAGVEGTILPQFGLNCGRHLVLAQSPTSLGNAANVQAMESFLAASPVDNNNVIIPGSPLPSSLLWVAGAAPAGQGAPRCEGVLELSNVGVHTIVITGAGFSVNDYMVLPSYHYNQLDTCSFSGAGDFGCGRPCSGDCGGSGSCGYEIHVTLGDAAQPDKRYQGSLINPNDPMSTDCPSPLTLNPGDVTDITITVRPPANSPTGIYLVTPFVVAPGAGEASLEYPKLITRLVYAPASDFTCYRYDSGHFSPIQPNDGFQHECL